jgi:uncharacterized protein
VQSPGGLLTVAVEDLDMYRSCFGLPVTDRLAPPDIQRLESLLAGAWQLIVADHPGYAGTMRECLGSVVPLVTPDTGSISASAQSTFGTVALSVPADAEGLALLLIHETQHMKLSAVLDLVELVVPGDSGRYHAPWRADPRPAGALLQGAYAHAGVTDFWRVRRQRAHGGPARRADFEFAYWLEQSRRAAGTLAGSGALTGHGELFVGQLIERLDGWRAEPLDEPISTGVADLATAVAVRWRLENHRPEPDLVARLASAWRTGSPCPPMRQPAVVPGRAAGPAPVEGLAVKLRAGLDDTTGPAGDLRSAIVACRNALLADPDSAVGWSDFALALAGTGDVDAKRGLAERPDLVRALLLELRRDGHPPAPDALAGWLAGGLPAASGAR